MKKAYNSPEFEITRLVAESIMVRIGSDDEGLTSDIEHIE